MEAAREDGRWVAVSVNVVVGPRGWRFQWKVDDEGGGEEVFTGGLFFSFLIFFYRI